MPYNGLETQRLLRQVENGTFRLLPGGELVDALYRQLKEADALIAQQDQALRAGARDGRQVDPMLAPRAFTPARILPSEHNPLGLTQDGTDTRTTPPAPLTPQRQLLQPRAGEVFNPFMAQAGVEAPPPVPFEQTRDPEAGTLAPARTDLQPAPTPAKRGRRIKLKP